MDKAWLERWPVQEDMSFIWIEVTGKDAYTRSRHSHPGRLMRTVVRHWTPGGSLQSAPAGYYRAAATIEKEGTTGAVDAS
jgi:hypothetical protein